MFIFFCVLDGFIALKPPEHLVHSAKARKRALIALNDFYHFADLFFTDNADNLIGGLSLGITFGMMIVGVIITSKNVTKIRKMKMRIVNKLTGRSE